MCICIYTPTLDPFVSRPCVPYSAMTINTSLNLRIPAQVPTGVDNPDTSVALFNLQLNAEVAKLRDTYGADLVQLISHFTDGFCGRG